MPGAKQVISADRAPTGPFSPAVRAGGFVYLSGAVATDDTGRLVGDTAAEQTAVVLQRISTLLEAAGSTLAQTAAVSVYLRRAADFAAMNDVYRSFWPDDPPTRTTVIADLAVPGALVEIAAVAVPAGGDRRIVRPDGWLPPPNPYSYAIRSGSTLFLSGLVPRRVRDNSSAQGEVSAQMDVILANAAEVLAAGGLTLDDVVRARVYLRDLAALRDVNAAYRTRFPGRPPVRTTVRVELTRPEFSVEMTLLAVAGPKQAIETTRPNPNLSAAIRAGDHLFVSGLLGATERTADDAAAQTHEALSRLDRLLEAGGFSRTDVVDAVVYLSDVAHYGPMNNAYRAFFGRSFPARATLGCGLVNPDGLVEIMATAVAGE
jgi:enamine deaminase RidA (YjgF/YER057c/UK114 family)